ncbi:proprotein convertase subtilisin/kexin type 4-like isoform X1 [Mya arenaria]|uniref:proprotein convertase subtilisin/kexin type 4-like isoform X1 n=1 Tax=Mya arenaria TaxID=6604 RepID=UPI0022E70BFB|nr:proprotein convertase subtilisin/kexin type 4-like isoform X1 [Mya arenaria]XP_052772295.1 proprotein convertase subtilisin/kexin type 4-like isoform X1 [Mya arenaria]XP_052772296.1 proprotein convertase subtilisin/kexin type 4-like isoform X1 [Mya arenaria]XP_052772297.1 proprotein convertase subtilisin/kexin type 4-like isoform X1 [Mya arenaria]XP_052772298.1 proprotein convertase subtilisin/kexin type 4-like isoform X1 [Mya arenaria]
MITVGHNAKRCDTTFGGESAATAIVSGMIALLLESNPRLSARDVKHILIESSSHLWIEASPEFVPNTAGKYYHPRLGFGLPDSSKMVLLGRRWNQLAPLCKSTLIFSKDSYHLKDLHWYLRVLYDNTFCDTAPCIEKMEEVRFEIEFVYSERHHMKLWAKSPSGTKSTLAEIKPVANGDKEKHVNSIFRSNHFWGENSVGRWHIYIGCNLPMSHPFPAYGCHVTKAHLTIHGTVETAYVKQHCNADTYPDDDRNKFPSVATDGKHVENNNIITNNFVTKNVNTIINNYASYAGLWIILGIGISIVVFLLYAWGIQKGIWQHSSKTVPGLICSPLQIADLAMHLYTVISQVRNKTEREKKRSETCSTP